MINAQTERRSCPRIDINGSMTYRTDNCDAIYLGKLENLSMRGARIWVDRELPAASQLSVRIEANEQQEMAMEFKATLIYSMLDRNKALYGYGCSIEETGCVKENC